ncbi:MAG: hypothetical protein EKK39_10820 [Sphingobacteriales bacterium]|uniref:translocation/assembly module TamB domain-containing protein n=1 Tax=Hydrotalea flava TaxID=714549 RepID=UPI00082971FA|nr:translocation/assembly module TamB domain-containing protein [Hydrotalea flava]RTL49387.1 MAG: hypothetical protein EKK39_10820 [Sphingobacteriales bacterium]
MAFIAIQTTIVQNWLIGIATKKLSKSLGTEVSIKKINVTLFNKLNLDGTLIRDRQKDTLLYAGALKLRITDWFFLKDSADLKYIGLDDAVVKLQRKDSVWNFQYIVDHFASPKSTNTKNGIALNLKKLEFNNIRFIKNDEWHGERITAKLNSLLLDADNINLNKGIFSINQLNLDHPYFEIANIHELRPDSIRIKDHQTNTPDTGLQFNTDNLLVQLKKLNIKNGTLSVQGNDKKPLPYFDGSHIYIQQLTGHFDEVSLIKDTLHCIANIAAKERSGIEIKRLKTKLTINPHIIELAKLDLLTNKSRLTNYYAMKFKHFNDDFSEYIHSVTMVAKFTEASVYSDDIAYFAPELKDWKKQININGHFEGTVANFSVQDLFARIGSGSYISGSLAMKGLPNLNKTLINFNNGIIKTNYNDVVLFVPSVKDMKVPDLTTLGDALFKGNFNGTIYNFTSNGTITSGLGGVAANVTMQIPQKKDITYSGNVITNHFNIGKFLRISQLGYVDFTGKISGSNFDIEKLKTQIEGKIASLDFNHYTYSNITTNGTFQKKYFNGEVKVDDPNMNFNSNVEVDLSKPDPSFNILGDLVNANLKVLNFYKDSLQLTGLLDIYFTGKTIDQFLGSAKFLNATITSADTQLSFDSLNLTSGYSADSVKFLKVGSNNFNGTIAGKFTILDLPNSFQSFLHRYYPAYFNEPAKIAVNQDFTLTIKTDYIEPLLQIYDKKISGLNDMDISGKVNTSKSIFQLSALVPYAKYDQYAVSGINLKCIGNYDSLLLSGSISDIQIKDSLQFPNTQLSIKAANDHSVVHLYTSTNNVLKNVLLNADVYTLNDGARIHFNPSSFILNEKKWNLDKQGEIIMRKNFVSASNVKFIQGFQEITVETDEEEGGNTNNLIVKLKNIFLGDITALFLKNPKLEGITNGEIYLRDFYGSFTAEAKLASNQLRLNDDSVGIVNIQSLYSSKSGKLDFTVTAPNKEYHINATGYYKTKDTTNKPLYVDIQLAHTKINYVEQFIGDIFNRLKGYGTGHLIIQGNPAEPDLSGNITLKKAALNVLYTQVYYTIDSANISFENDGINFNEFYIKDSLNNTGLIKGKLYEKGFKDLAFDFDLFTNKLIMLDTKAVDNSQFYGNATGKATLSFKGPERNARLTIIGDINEPSHIYIPNSVSKESGEADFIVFKTYGTEMTNERQNSNFNLLVDLDVAANNKLNVDVILDPLSGDVIKAKGNGRLKIRVGTKDPLTIRGRYNIEEGSYAFNFQSFIRKPFILKPDAGNFIEWNGDPFNADVHIDAQYTAENISVNDLISNQSGQFSGTSRAYRGSVYVIAELRNRLSHPDITFKLDFPQGSPLKTDPTFSEFINRIENNQNEMLKQVTYLIVLERFAPYGDIGGANTNFTNIGVNTISQIITRELNKAISNIVYKITKDKSLKVDLGTSVYSSSDILSSATGAGIGANTNALDRSRINFKVGKSFFNDNVIVSFGGDFDFGISAAAQSGNFQWLPDFNLEIILTKDRQLRAIIFSKNSLDINAGALGRTSRQGAGLSYKKDFEKLFGNKEKNTTIKPPADSTLLQ